MGETIRVRIAVRVEPDGEWDSRGWGYPGGAEKDYMLTDGLDEGALDARYPVIWVEADVPVPAELPAGCTVEGEVQDGR
jgi:hypothetical protein